MVGSSQANSDPWIEIEAAAQSLFQSWLDTRTPGIRSTMARAIHYALVERDGIILDRLAFLHGLVSEGLASPSGGNTASWVATWLRSNNPSAASSLPTLVTRADEADILSSFASGLRVKSSRSMDSFKDSASNYADQTIGTGRKPALRHLFAALCNDSRAAAAFAELGWKLSDADLASLRQAVFDGIARSPEKGEDMEAWRAILGASTTEGQPSSVARVLPEFTPDLPGRGDRLGVTPDVNAFAQLICLAQVELPLSIGLFGGWGSGKSTFMQLLEEAIDGLIGHYKGAPEATSGPSFVRNIVQIRFNAWHFADANLWASLTAEFFDQLRAGGYKRSGAAIHARLVERVNEHVHALTSEAEQTRAALSDSVKAERAALKARQEAIESAKATSGQVLRQTLIDAVTQSYADHKDELRDLGQRFNYDDPAADIDNFVQLAASVQSVCGQIDAVAKSALVGGWRKLLILLAVGLALWCLALIVPMLSSSGSSVGSWITALLPLLAGLGAFVGTILPGVKAVAAIAKGTADFAGKLDTAQRTQLAEVAQSEEALRRASAETQARQAAVKRATEALARYVDPNSTSANPPRVLRFMLEDDPDTQSLEKEIGLISRVRRLFQAVDEVILEEQQLGAKGDPNVPDRIVLYIDDLDRCTPGQVYSVLQAIHLLLAFRIFVVVVGVDVNWAAEALARELRPDRGGSGVSSLKARREEERESLKLATRYMEKIFQLPFWLRPLSPLGANGGSYGAYVRDTLGEAVSTYRATPPAAPNKSVGAATEKTVEATLQPENASREPAEGAGRAGAYPGPEFTIAELQKEEIELLASAEIGALAGSEPRTVKRFINVYRLVRTRALAIDRDAFFGEKGKLPGYPVIAFLTAAETGQALEAVELLREKINATGDLLQLDLGLPELSSMQAAATAIAKLRANHPITGAECRQWAAIVRRYSFYRYD